MSARSIFFAIAGAVMWLGAFLGDPLFEKTERGNQLVAEGKLDEALKQYTDAQLIAPESPELHYNIGIILYRQQEYEKAAEEFQRSLESRRPEIQAQAYYNLGNTYVQMNEALKAVESYQKGLNIAPDDEDIKFNLELAQRLMKSGPSEEALKRKAKIEELVAEQKYGEAYRESEAAQREEPSFIKLGDFVQRVSDLAEIFAPEVLIPEEPTPQPQPTPWVPFIPLPTPTPPRGLV